MFPSDQTAIIDALVGGQCGQAGALLAAANGNTQIDQQIFNSQINSRYSDVLATLLAQFTGQCSAQMPPVLAEANPGGRLAAFTIDPNRLFIAPDGRAVKLPAGATPKFFNFGAAWGLPPVGTLQGFTTADGTMYFAEITNSPLRFRGYRRAKTPFCPALYYETANPALYPALSAGQVADVYYLQDYSSLTDCGVYWLEGSYTFRPDAYQQPSTLPPPGANWPHPNVTTFSSCSYVVPIDGNLFTLQTSNGNLTVTGSWQDFGKCVACKAIAEAALQAALDKARLANNNTLTLTTTVVSSTTVGYGTAGKVVYQSMKLMDVLTNLSKTYNSLLDRAQVPPQAWQPGQTFYVRDETGVISGAIDQALEEAKDLPELVGLGLTVVSDPAGAKRQLSNFAQQMDWQKAQALGADLAKDAVQYENFEKGGAYARYGTGRIGVTIGLAIATGGLVAMVQNAPNQLKKSLDDLAAFLDNTGKFVDAVLEANYQQYLLRKAGQGKPARERLDWKKERDYWLNDSPIARGNAFNAKSVRDRWYPVNELNLSNGKRLDSYLPPSAGNAGEIVSRKATSLEDIELSTFESYLKEMQIKYAPGTVIRSNKYPAIDGQTLQGKQILEIPALNQNFNQLQDYIDLAKNKYGIEIRFRSE